MDKVMQSLIGDDYAVRLAVRWDWQVYITFLVRRQAPHIVNVVYFCCWKSCVLSRIRATSLCDTQVNIIYCADMMMVTDSTYCILELNTTCFSLLLVHISQLQSHHQCTTTMFAEVVDSCTCSTNSSSI